MVPFGLSSGEESRGPGDALVEDDVRVGDAVRVLTEEVTSDEPGDARVLEHVALVAGVVAATERLPRAPRPVRAGRVDTLSSAGSGGVVRPPDRPGEQVDAGHGDAPCVRRGVPRSAADVRHRRSCVRDSRERRPIGDRGVGRTRRHERDSGCGGRWVRGEVRVDCCLDLRIGRAGRHLECAVATEEIGGTRRSRPQTFWR